ncbi:MAG: BpuSI family type II restriction endonuclease, partial [Vallitaleaceae bacterium]|nr:BpuSI family type II restriction endonuclease [Vallitaleaceae bacterium]
MWISHSDSEVNVFHPICERALNIALRKSGMDTTYCVLHHQYTGVLEMDYVVQNIVTGKYLCVVEVKRTPADVHSARYQFQAMSYVQMNAGESERPFYILTNLEYAFAFRYDATRPRVFQQMLKPGLNSIGDFGIDSEADFVEKLSDYFKNLLDDFRDNRYEYLVTLEQFAQHMDRIKKNQKQWKSSLAVLLYEYIRGAFTFIKRNELRDVRLFHNDISRICDEAARINFKEIFTYQSTHYEPRVTVDNAMLVNLFDFGNQNITGDSVAGILHEIVSAGHEHEGEVPTDLELARVVAELAHYISGDLGNNELVCDPAAGSGN